MTKNVVETPNYYLRTFQDKDFEDIFVLLQDQEVMKFTGFRRVQTKEESLERLSNWCQDDRVWAAFEKSSHSLVGWFMLKPTITEYPELGFMISKPYWGNGIATEISKSLLEFANIKLKSSKVIACTDSNNFASQKVLKKIGMVKATDFPIKDNVIYYVITFHKEIS